MTKDAFDTVKALAIVFCMIFTIVISSMIWGEWQDYKRKFLSERREANTSYIEKPVAIPADGYLAFRNKYGTNIIIVDPKKLYFDNISGKTELSRY